MCRWKATARVGAQSRHRPREDGPDERLAGDPALVQAAEAAGELDDRLLDALLGDRGEAVQRTQRDAQRLVAVDDKDRHGDRDQGGEDAGRDRRPEPADVGEPRLREHEDEQDPDDVVDPLEQPPWPGFSTGGALSFAGEHHDPRGLAGTHRQDVVVR